MERLIRSLADQEGVSALFVFGLRRHRYTRACKARLAVLLDDALIRQEDIPRLRQELPPEADDVIILNSASPFLKYHVVRKGCVVLDKDPGHRVRFTELAVTEFFNHYRPAGDVSLDGASASTGESECLDLDV